MTGLLQPATPFGEPLDEILLAEPPLVSVVAQLRFPPIASIASDTFVGPFQEAIRADYPVLRQEHEVRFAFTQAGATSEQAGVVWRFTDVDGRWAASLASSFLALETSSYVDRDDFVVRWRALLDALAATIAPATFDRFGLRYVDRVLLDDVGGSDALATLVRPEVSGVATCEFGVGGELVHSITDAEFKVGGDVLHGRWGVLPPNAQLLPLRDDPVDQPTWLLDLDMYTEQATAFEPDSVAGLTSEFADRIYRFFRWAVEPDLLRHYGGAV